MKQQFFSLLFPDLKRNGLIEIREIDPVDESVKKIFFNRLDKLFRYDPPNDKNIYFGLYVRGYKKKNNGKISGASYNCLRTHAICLDFDGLSLDKIKGKIRNAKIPNQSIIVSSGNGYHCYWILKSPFYDLTKLVKEMVKITGADPNSTDKARVFRFPDTNNVKDPFNIKQCKIVSINDNVYDISVFQKLFPVPIEITQKKSYKNVIDHKNIGIKRYCIKQILKGVPDGFRHWCLGRLTKYFQVEGYKQEIVRQTILEWNQKNKPPLHEKDILDSFYKYWVEDYKLLGCKIADATIQAKLSRFCDKAECKMRFVGSELDFTKSFGLNNRIFNDYRKVTGYELILYGIFSRHPEGLTSSEIDDKLTNKTSGKQCMGRDNKREALKALCQNDFIQVIHKNRKAGKEDFYRLKKQGTFGLGYTVLTNGAINGAIDGRITAKKLKIYALLCKYGWSKEAFPSLETLSEKTGISRSVISRHIKGLLKADYLKRYYGENDKGVSKPIYQLLV